MSLHPSRSIHSYYRYIYIVILLFVFIYFSVKVVQSFTKSLFFSSNSRVNVLFYGKESTFYSIDKKDARHYVMYFAPDLKMQVPGGYGSHRVGSLGKLTKLDKNPDILQKTFSVATTSFISQYYYSDTEEVFYGDEVPTEKKRPTLSQLLLLRSNGNFFDRLYLFFTFMEKKSEDFHIISYSEKINAIQDDVYFQEDSFIKESIGLLYQKNYRDEQKSIQIQYPEKYQVAESIGSLLEGNGIRVSDISLDINKRTHCSIIESTETPSVTAKDLSAFFKCPITKGRTDVYDIVFILGESEKRWEVLQ